ncbi:MAG: error-prone DNA polymerase [Proteobacteria bacterium]|nr:error-prone DNA polymerase [Pseudomonadota bacterium]
MAAPDYAELHALSNFTFLRGASHPEELVERAVELGYRALALTDECSLAGVVRAHVAARAGGLPLLIGSELALADGPRLVLLATDRAAYGRLVALLTRGRRAAPKGRYHLTRADLDAALPAGCLALWLPGAVPDAADGRWLRERFGRDAWLAVELNASGGDRARLAALTALGAALGLPAVASGDVHLHRRERQRLQDVLTAVRLGVTVDAAGHALYPNAERCLKPREELARRYPAALLAATLAVAERATFSLEELRYEYPEELVPAGHTPTSWLAALTERGLARRFPGGTPPAVRALVDRELALIAELGYEPFFLTVEDLVSFARGRGILCQGRGSAANSAVCYALGITEVDPSRMSLLFERFVSKERNEPPDIDVDFEHERREEVIQYLYAKYGRHRAAIAATVISYRPRSALRDVGKALGLDAPTVERLARSMQWWDGKKLDDERVREAGLDPANPVLGRALELARELIGFPRHLSQHVGGFVIARHSLADLVPVENATMADRTVIEWDKDDLDDLGLLKVDVLGLGMLTAIRRALDFVAARRGRPLTMADVPAEDPATYAMISRADTIGVFQIESRAQMAMLPRLRPRNYYDLVIEVAIIRPGPIQGDMVHPYLRRRNGEEPVSYPSSEVQGVLERTLGVPIFQEQVMQLAVVAAGFTPGEADRLRRAMAAWKRRGGLGHFEARLIDGMRERGYSEPFARAIFQQILGFGEYGFPECVVGSTRVIDAKTGAWVTIDDVVAGRASLQETLACDDKLKLRRRRVIDIRSSGVKPVFRLKTALGHTIEATAEHPLLTVDGWRKLGQLRIGDCVAAARALKLNNRLRWPRFKLLVLADLIAEGNLCHPNTFYFHTTERWHCDDFVRAVERFANTEAVVERHHNCFSVRVRRIDRTKPSAAVTWLKTLGVWGHSARHKHLPKKVFELADPCISLLLARMWEGDGGFSKAGIASYDTASSTLAAEVQHLLLRLGIVSRISARKRLYRNRINPRYVVTITGSQALKLFWNRIGRRFISPEKRHASLMLSMTPEGRSSRDIVPISVRALIRKERDAAALTWCDIERLTGLCMRDVQSRVVRRKRGFRRSVIDRLASALKSESLQTLASSDIYWDRIVGIEPVGRAETFDLTIEKNHSFLANNLIVHNSHSASFALLVYVSAWLKCHEPAAFAAALLNSQPMGFYAPAQIVRDAREHGVEVRPVDVHASDAEATLEGEPPALRLGLGQVRGLSAAGIGRLLAARAVRPFNTVQDMAERAQLDRRDLGALAASGALAALAGHRHRAAWEVGGVVEPTPLFAATRIAEATPLLRTPREGEAIVADYRALGLTLGRHPLALLRERLRARGLETAVDLRERRHGARARACGLVLVRQRPGSASGVTFVTLEDETGVVNLVVWRQVGERWRRPLLEAQLLEASGRIQREGEVLHLVVERLVDHSRLLGSLTTRSRDFH